jgi:hypothetical protein
VPDRVCPLDHGCEPGLDLGGHRRQLVVLDDREHPLRVDRRDVGLPASLVDDDVAGKERPQVGLGLERAVGERWVAGPEDHVRLDLDAELLPHRGGDVDLAQDAESLVLQLRAHPLDRVGDGEARRRTQCVAGCRHSHSSSR